MLRPFFNNYSPNFTGTTKIYAMTDSHQESRKTGAFFSKVLQDDKDSANVLLLNGGDMFKGIYPRELERDCYLKIKEEKPDAEMVVTLGNNDFGFNKEQLDFLVDTVKTFTQKGVHVVCSNIFDESGNRPSWIKPYTVVERDGDRSFVTGFCIDNINTKKFGIVPRQSKEVLDEIVDAISVEKPDNVIILNHDYMPVSKDIVESCKEKGINVDLVVGGHDHEKVEPDTELKIYYPEPFNDMMYSMNLTNDENGKRLSDIQEIRPDNITLEPTFSDGLEKYEKESGLLEDITPYTLNLTKQYSKPCPLGTFLADKMKESADADIAFFSTGLLMKSMDYHENQSITNYLFKKTMVAELPLKSVELSVKDLKDVFSHSLKSYGYGLSNPKFIQCSNNLKVVGVDNKDAEQFIVKQIYINDTPLLDENSNPIDTNKKFKCVTDSYLSDGGQGFTMLKNLDKKTVLKDGEPLKINEVLMDGLKSASETYEKGSEYPSYEIIS